jgi:hypothetical protein
MPPASSGFLFRGRTHPCSAGTAVIADAAQGKVGFDHGRPVNIMYPANVYVVDGPIVEEMSVSPITAIVASPGISETVVDAAVVADNRTPVAGMPVVSRALIIPVTGSPQQVRFGGQHPGGGYPVVSRRTPSPIPGHPDVILARTKGLLVNGQWRWTDGDR